MLNIWKCPDWFKPGGSPVIPSYLTLDVREVDVDGVGGGGGGGQAVVAVLAVVRGHGAGGREVVGVEELPLRSRLVEEPHRGALVTTAGLRHGGRLTAGYVLQEDQSVSQSVIFRVSQGFISLPSEYQKCHPDPEVSGCQ